MINFLLNITFQSTTGSDVRRSTLSKSLPKAHHCHRWGLEWKSPGKLTVCTPAQLPLPHIGPVQGCLKPSVLVMLFFHYAGTCNTNGNSASSSKATWVMGILLSCCHDNMSLLFQATREWHVMSVLFSCTWAQIHNGATKGSQAYLLSICWAWRRWRPAGKNTKEEQ